MATLLAIRANNNVTIRVTNAQACWHFGGGGLGLLVLCEVHNMINGGLEVIGDGRVI